MPSIMAEEIVLSDHNVPRIPLQDELTRLYSQGFLTDITLSTEDGKNFEAHKILLAARSHYFHSVVPRLKSDPVIFLKGVKGAHLDKILKFIYSGKVALSRHQLKPILEVAKSLQVAGLCDANPTDILQQQQPSALGASRFRTDSSGSGSPHVLQRMQTDKKLGSPVGSSSGSFKTPSRRAISKTSPFGAKSSLANGSPPGSDSEDDKKESEPEEEDDGKTVSEVSKPKKKRGRPPKNVRAATKDKGGDPYEFDEEMGETADASAGTNNDDAKKSWRHETGSSAAKRSRGEEDQEAGEGEAEEGESLASIANRRERSNKYATSSINGKQVLSVRCNDKNAELHLSRFANGIRGKSINYKDEWMTPQEFELACGSTGKRYLENIQTDYGALKALTTSGLLKPHSRKCRCSICRGDESAKSSSPEKLRRNVEGELDDVEMGEEAGFVTKEERSDDFEFGVLGEDASTQNFPLAASKHDVMKGGVKRKKKKHKNSEWRKQLNEKVAQANMTMSMAATTNDIIQQGMTVVPMNNGGAGGLVQTSEDDMGISGTATFSYTSVYEMPPKISSPATVLAADRIEPPPMQQPTFYVMSPHPHAAPPTPQHNPFSVPMPPPSPMLSPAPQLTPILQPPPTPPITLQAPEVDTPSPVPITTTSVVTTPKETVPAPTTPRSTSSTSSTDSGGTAVSETKAKPTTGVKFGAVMNVRCKSTTALLYACKYETGSKGKCINLGNEWLTPNEFEDRAGSKAKKYLSSIKCMGRPLRVYVNSGELKGSGPPPAPKPKKQPPSQLLAGTKPTPIQPIAPAPPPPSVTPIPITMAVAPPTPTHMSSAPPVPANLNVMMGNPNHGGPPILINQTSMGGNTVVGNQPFLNATPMTFTIAQPIEVRQNVSQTM